MIYFVKVIKCVVIIGRKDNYENIFLLKCLLWCSIMVGGLDYVMVFIIFLIKIFL